jgi:hypothetical protein
MILQMCNAACVEVFYWLTSNACWVTQTPFMTHGPYRQPICSLSNTYKSTKFFWFLWYILNVNVVEAKGLKICLSCNLEHVVLKANWLHEKSRVWGLCYDWRVIWSFWSLQDSLAALKHKRQRTVYRLTLVKGWNTEEVKAYSELLELGQPDFIEIKGVTYCGS